MKCPDCPVASDRECIHEDARHLCHRPEYRALADRTARTPELLPLVVACPDRGPVLPVSQQRDGCRSCELSECRAAKGPPARPVAVTLEECLNCVAATAPRPPRSGIPGRAG